MKTITFLKATTIGMGILIFAGFIAIFVKIADIRPKSKSLSARVSEVVLVFPENIKETMPCGDKLCVMTVGHESGRRLIIVNPESGRAESIITFKEML